MDLVAAYDSDSDENSSSDKDNDSHLIPREKNESVLLKKIKLPSAAEVIERRPSSEGSVFMNTYDREDHIQSKVLEQHVKMVDRTVNLSSSVNGKQICWMYRKGRCYKGKRCNMFHDSEIRTTEIKVTGNKKERKRQFLPMQQTDEVELDREDSDDQMLNKTHKKRYGLSDNIVPSKKVLRHIQRVDNSHKI